MDKEFFDKYSKQFHCGECVLLKDCLAKHEPLYVDCREQFLRDKLSELEAKLAEKEKAFDWLHEKYAKYVIKAEKEKK